MKKIVEDISELVGNTPILKLKGEAEASNVFLKLEFSIQEAVLKIESHLV